MFADRIHTRVRTYRAQRVRDLRVCIRKLAHNIAHPRFI